MVRSPLFGLLTITLYLVASLCAHAAVSKEEALKIISESEISTKQALKKGQENFNKALEYLTEIKIYKEIALRAIQKAEREAEGNPNLTHIFRRAGKMYDNFHYFFSREFVDTQKNVFILKQIMSKAKDLVGKADKTYSKHVKAGDDPLYWSSKESDFGLPLTLKESSSWMYKADVLNKAIETFPHYGNAYFRQSGLKSTYDASLVSSYHVQGSAALAKIESVLESVESNISIIEKKLEEMTATVDEMKKMNKIGSNIANKQMNALCISAEDLMHTAKRGLQEANKVKKYMFRLKEESADCVAKIETEIKVEKAEDNAINAQWNANEVARRGTELKKALNSVMTYAENVNFLKISAMKEIGEANLNALLALKGENVDTTMTNELHSHVKDLAESSTMSEAKQTKRTNTEESLTGASDQSIDEDSVQSINDKSGEEQIDNSTQALPGAAERLKNDNSGGNGIKTLKQAVTGEGKTSIAFKLKHHVQHRVNCRLLGVEQFAPRLSPYSAEQSDSSMVVSVQLLLALIAYAVLH